MEAYNSDEVNAEVPPHVRCGLDIQRVEEIAEAFTEASCKLCHNISCKVHGGVKEKYATHDVQQFVLSEYLCHVLERVEPKNLHEMLAISAIVGAMIGRASLLRSGERPL